MCEIIHFACKITHGVWNYTFCANYRMCMKSTLLIALTFCNRNTPHTVSGVFDKFKVWAHTHRRHHHCYFSDNSNRPLLHNVHNAQCSQMFTMSTMRNVRHVYFCTICPLLCSLHAPNCFSQLYHSTLIHTYVSHKVKCKEFDDCH